MFVARLMRASKSRGIPNIELLEVPHAAAASSKRVVQSRPTISFNCVFGIAAANAFLFNRVFVLCSKANPNPIKSNSVNAVPKNDSPKGMPGAG